MSKRIFQNYTGNIKELEGANFNTVKAAVDTDRNSVIVLWMHELNANAWYRVFIDGVYCGIDRFKSDRSTDDLDEGVVLKDFSSRFRGRTLLSAVVSDHEEGKSVLKLTLHCDSRDCCLAYHMDSGICVLSFGD